MKHWNSKTLKMATKRKKIFGEIVVTNFRANVIWYFVVAPMKHPNHPYNSKFPVLCVNNRSIGALDLNRS